MLAHELPKLKPWEGFEKEVAPLMGAKQALPEEWAMAPKGARPTMAISPLHSSAPDGEFAMLSKEARRRAVYFYAPA